MGRKSSGAARALTVESQCSMARAAYAVVSRVDKVLELVDPEGPHVVRHRMPHHAHSRRNWHLLDLARHPVVALVNLASLIRRIAGAVPRGPAQMIGCGHDVVLGGARPPIVAIASPAVATTVVPPLLAHRSWRPRQKGAGRALCILVDNVHQGKWSARLDLGGFDVGVFVGDLVEGPLVALNADAVLVLSRHQHTTRERLRR